MIFLILLIGFILSMTLLIMIAFKSMGGDVNYYDLENINIADPDHHWTAKKLKKHEQSMEEFIAEQNLIHKWNKEHAETTI